MPVLIQMMDGLVPRDDKSLSQPMMAFLTDAYSFGLNGLMRGHLQHCQH